MLVQLKCKNEKILDKISMVNVAVEYKKAGANKVEYLPFGGGIKSKASVMGKNQWLEKGKKTIFEILH